MIKEQLHNYVQQLMNVDNHTVRLAQTMTMTVAEHLLAHYSQLLNGIADGQIEQNGIAKQLHAGDEGSGNDARNLAVNVLPLGPSTWMLTRSRDIAEPVQYRDELRSDEYYPNVPGSPIIRIWCQHQSKGGNIPPRRS